MHRSTATYENAPIFFATHSEKKQTRRKTGLDYSTFGSNMPARSFQSSNYRYGFNGKEMDNEMHNNSGDSYDFSARIYDARLGRWLSVDPHQAKYPKFSPYNYVEDMPIHAIDSDGRDIIVLERPGGAQSSGNAEGHMAALIGSDETGWRFVSKEGRDPNGPWYSNSVTGGPSYVKTGVFTSLDAFYAAQQTDVDLQGYTESVRLASTPTQDDAAYDADLAAANSWFSVTESNCADAVSAGLTAAGLDPGWVNNENPLTGTIEPGLPVQPNYRFEAIKENNSTSIVPTNPATGTGTTNGTTATTTGTGAANGATAATTVGTGTAAGASKSKSSSSASSGQPATTRSPGSTGTNTNPRSGLLLNQPGDM